jgi:hypothetical protein
MTTSLLFSRPARGLSYRGGERVLYASFNRDTPRNFFPSESNSGVQVEVHDQFGGARDVEC